MTIEHSKFYRQDAFVYPHCIITSNFVTYGINSRMEWVLSLIFRCRQSLWSRDSRVEPRISDQKSWIKILSYAKSRKPFGIFSFDANSEHGNVPNRKTYFVGKNVLRSKNRVTSCLGGKKVSVFKLPNDIYFHLKWKRLDVMKVLF